MCTLSYIALKWPKVNLWTKVSSDPKKEYHFKVKAG